MIIKKVWYSLRCKESRAQAAIAIAAIETGILIRHFFWKKFHDVSNPVVETWQAPLSRALSRCRSRKGHGTRAKVSRTPLTWNNRVIFQVPGCESLAKKVAADKRRAFYVARNMRCTVLHNFNDLDVGVDVGCGEAKKVVRFSCFFPPPPYHISLKTHLYVQYIYSTVSIQIQNNWCYTKRSSPR